MLFFFCLFFCFCFVVVREPENVDHTPHSTCSVSNLKFVAFPKQSGEQSRISYSPKVIRTNEIARSVIIT